MSLDLAKPGGTSGVGLANPEVLSGPQDDTDTEGSTGHLNGRATTGRGVSPETNNRNANGDDHSQLPYFRRETRRQQHVEAGHGLESVA
ncbi:hypothetical protein NDU88_004584 [Pleurodeles waltl]|uniref:Uncharacterized protein n=1 Tax=Pleurodeles waltl TaxID=8319 RepID=A0AAV7SJ98_PLEWA|nr:hypothetical protein NDU88_004584 [Pleurodeles waltl]